MAKRPLLITIVGALYLIVGVAMLLTGVAGYIADSSAVPLGELIVGLVGGAISLIIGLGLLKGIRIIWYVAVIFAAIYLILSVILAVMDAVDGDFVNVAASIIQAIIYAIIIWYLRKDGVKDFFGISS